MIYLNHCQVFSPLRIDLLGGSPEGVSFSLFIYAHLTTGSDSFGSLDFEAVIVRSSRRVYLR